MGKIYITQLTENVLRSIEASSSIRWTDRDRPMGGFFASVGRGPRMLVIGVHHDWDLAYVDFNTMGTAVEGAIFLAGGTFAAKCAELCPPVSAVNAFREQIQPQLDELQKAAGRSGLKVDTLISAMPDCDIESKPFSYVSSDADFVSPKARGLKIERLVSGIDIDLCSVYYGLIITMVGHGSEYTCVSVDGFYGAPYTAKSKIEAIEGYLSKAEKEED